MNKMHPARVIAVLALILFGLLAPAPASAQVMRDDGLVLPSFFFSSAQQNARRACLAELPECRDSVRQQIATEKAISRMLPWILVCLAIWAAVRFVNMREKKRERARQNAARHHVRASVRERDAKEEARAKARAERENEDDDADGYGMR